MNNHNFNIKKVSSGPKSVFESNGCINDIVISKI